MSNQKKPHEICLNELPYLDWVPNDGRAVVISTYYDHDTQQFFAYAKTPNGNLIRLRPAGFIEGTYISTLPADPVRDYPLDLSEFITQYLSFPDMFAVLQGVEHDLQNALASLHKYFVLLHYVNKYNVSSDRLLISTEIEYAFGNHRAFYDRLHEVLRTVHAKYTPNPPAIPDSYARVVLKTPEQLKNKYKLPTPMIEFYCGTREQFLKARDIRDGFYHHGHQPGFLVRLEEGFGISLAHDVRSKLVGLDLWPEDLRRAHQIGSLLPVLSYLVKDMLDAMEGLRQALLRSFDPLPRPIAPGYHVYFRTTLAQHLVSLADYQRLHWFNSEAVLDLAKSGRESSASS